MRRGVSSWRRFSRWWLVLALATMASGVGATTLQSIQTSQTAEGLRLTATVQVVLNSQVQQALERGVPLYFVHQVQVVQPRWWWRDQVVTNVTRRVRIARQALTRQWRVAVLPDESSNGSAPQTGQAMSMTVPSVEAALALVGKVGDWLVLPQAEWPDVGEPPQMVYRFYLDTSELPGPFQIGQGSSAEWSVRLEAVRPLGLRAAPLSVEGAR